MLKFVKKTDGIWGVLPNPNGNLSANLSPRTIIECNERVDKSKTPNSDEMTEEITHNFHLLTEPKSENMLLKMDNQVLFENLNLNFSAYIIFTVIQSRKFKTRKFLRRYIFIKLRKINTTKFPVIR